MAVNYITIEWAPPGDTPHAAPLELQPTRLNLKVLPNKVLESALAGYRG